jgi:hypothetical protein
MKKIARAGRLVVLLSLVAAAPVWGQTATSRTKVTIRGSGSDVTIERTPAAKSPTAERRNVLSQSGLPSAPAAPGPGEGVLAEVARLKSAGADDAVALAYLRDHQARLPAVIPAGDVEALRKAGAGKPVLVALSALAAVDIGETGEGYPAPIEVVSPGVEPEGEYEMYPASYGYPILTGFGGGGGHRHFTHPHPRPHPVPPHPHPMRPMGTTFRRDVGF